MRDEVDRTLSQREGSLLEEAMEGAACAPEEPTFWLDMCSHIATNVSEYVNLQRNPER